MKKLGLFFGLIWGCASAIPSAPVAPAPPPPPPVAVLAPPPPKPQVQVKTATLTLVSQESVLPNGLKLVWVPREHSTLSAAVLQLSGGALDDGDRPGVARVANLLWLGDSAQDLKYDLVQKLVKSGATFGLDIQHDRVQVQVVGADTQLAGMLDFLAAVRSPRKFTSEDFDDQKNRLYDDLWSLERGPLSKAERQLRGAIYGAHTYGRWVEGDRQALGPMRFAHAQGYIQKALCPERAQLVISGGVPSDVVVALVKKYLGPWKKCGKASAPSAAPGPQPRKKWVLVDDPDRARALVLVGVGVPGLTAETSAGLELAAEILAGSVGALLQTELREAGGFTYGVKARTEFLRGAGSLMLEISVQPERVQELLQRLVQVLERLTVQAPSPELMAQAQHRLDVVRIARIHGAEGAALEAANRLGAGLPLLPVRLGADRWAEVVGRYLQSEYLQLVVVGDASALREPLAAAGWGTLQVVR